MYSIDNWAWRRPHVTSYRRPLVDLPSLLVGFGAGALFALGLCALVAWRVTL